MEDKNTVDFENFKNDIVENKSQKYKKETYDFLRNAYRIGGVDELEDCICRVALWFKQNGMQERDAVVRLIFMSRISFGGEVASELTSRFSHVIGVQKKENKNKGFSKEELDEAEQLLKHLLKSDKEELAWTYKQKLDAVNKLAISTYIDNDVVEVRPQTSKNGSGLVVIKDDAELANGGMGVGLILRHADEIRIKSCNDKNGEKMIAIEYAVVMGNDEFGFVK